MKLKNTCFIMSLLLLTGCGKLCTGYPGIEIIFENIETNDVIVFESLDSSIEFQVETVSIRNPESNRGLLGLLAFDQNCLYEASYETKLSNEFTLREFVDIENAETHIFWEIFLSDEDEFFISKLGPDPIFDNTKDTIINNVELENIRTMRSTTNPTIDLIVHSNLDGLVGFRNKITGELFLKM